MSGVELLAQRLEEAGFAVAGLEATTGGCVCVAAMAALCDSGRVFAKTMAEPEPTMFTVEAAGLSALRELGGVRVPTVVHVSPQLLVLEELQPRTDRERFWDQLGRMVAELHTSTISGRFGWHRDGWHGRMRQDNCWETDGHAFFAQHRILRWLREPLVLTEFDIPDRLAVERLCAELPELIPPHAPALTHGDMWPGNILADSCGEPALIDPAVSYCWPEIDLAALWCQPRAQESERFFAVYEELAHPFDGWRDQAQLLRIWDLFSVVAHGLDTWGAADIIRKVVAPFRRRSASSREQAT
ncbi:fructosamine kinase family protein [Nocardia amamiensis]|uniref:fructosamine kinase family protein n=1 Tax=Nocardia amamiensis TaxID=404578 RepID=UPI00082BE7C4|nr:fructosamine kinase family protein [Nocardia amamiensis]